MQKPPDPISSEQSGPAQSRLFQLVFLVAVVAIAVVLTLWVTRENEPTGVEIFIPTPAPVVFQVTGAVNAPGVYSLDGSPRITDVIDAAGGLTDEADEGRINLALVVRDGARIDIPKVGDSTTATGSGNLPGVTQGVVNPEPVTTGTSGLLDLNSATKDELVSLPGIGEVRAQSIIDWRSTNLITAVDDLLAISGIGHATVDSIRDHVIQP
jgi:competence protein ComEA